MKSSLQKTLTPIRKPLINTFWVLFLVYRFTCVFASNCSETNVSLVSCGLRNSTKDQCLGWGCCWNSSSDENMTQCYGVANNQSSTSYLTKTTSVPTTTIEATSVKQQTISRKGSCHIYKGGVCDKWLNMTLREYRWSPRFVDNKHGMNKTETVTKIFLEAVDSIEKGQERCKTLLRTALCQYVFPPCNDDMEPYPRCREDCEALFQQCDSAMTEMLGVAKHIFKAGGLNFSHIDVPTCTKFRYSHEYKAENKTCQHWGVFDFASSMPLPQEKSKVFLIAAVVAGVSLFLLIIVIILCACIRRKHNKPLALGRNGVVSFAAMNMRDRIKAESMHSLDALGHYNPDVIKQFPLGSVEYIRDLGSGNFGMVFLGKAYGLVTGEEGVELMVAVKSLKEGSSIETKENFFKEVALMSLLHHENIVELLAVSTEEEPYGMIFEFMELGDLNQYLRKAGPFFEGDENEKVTLTQGDLLSIALQCASGMEHLQTLRFVHRDVATRNCLVGTGMVVKISDFGMSRDIYVSDYYKVEGRALLPVRWMPPEALLLGKFTVESDIYSFGVLLWEIYTLALQPYYGYNNEDVIEFIIKGVHLGQPEGCPDLVYQVMKSCWKRDGTERPNFTVIKARLKQEVTSHHDPSAETEVNIKQPLYQNIGVLTEEMKNLEGNQPTDKICSQNIAQTSKNDANSNHVYINANQGCIDEDVDMIEELTQYAPGASKHDVKSKPVNINTNCNHGYLNGGMEMGIEVA